MGGLGRGRRMTLQSKSPPVHRWRKLRPCALSMWMYNFFHPQIRQANDGKKKKKSYSLCDEWLISMPANGGLMWRRACWGDWFKSVSLSSSSLVWYQATSHTSNASVVSPSTLELIEVTLGWLTGIPEILWLVTLWYRKSDCGSCDGIDSHVLMYHICWKYVAALKTSKVVGALTCTKCVVGNVTHPFYVDCYT